MCGHWLDKVLFTLAFPWLMKNERLRQTCPVNTKYDRCYHFKSNFVRFRPFFVRSALVNARILIR